MDSFLDWSNAKLVVSAISTNRALAKDHLRFNIWHNINGMLFLSVPDKSMENHICLYVEYNNHQFYALKSKKAVTPHSSAIIKYTSQKLWPSRHINTSAITHTDTLEIQNIITRKNAVLLGWSDDIRNYYHLLFDLCGRIVYAEKDKDGHNAEYYILGPSSRLINNILKILFPAVAAKTKYLPLRRAIFSIINLPMVPEPSYLDFSLITELNSRINAFLSSGKEPSTFACSPEKIYIKRGKAVNGRRIENENLLCNALEEHGFSVYTMDELDVADQWQLFRNARVIVSPHGAALANLLACKKQSHVIELAPYSFSPNTYMYISACLELVYERYTYGNPVNTQVVNIENVLQLVTRATL